MTIIDGQQVAYAGDGDDGLLPDDRGEVLSAGSTGSHVKWRTGAQAGRITLTANFDLVPMGGARISYDDFESGSLVTFAVKETFEHRGAIGLLNALNDEGHLASLEALAEEALALVARKLRDDPSIREVLAHLDDDDGSEFVSFTATCLMRDAFKEVE